MSTWLGHYNLCWLASYSHSHYCYCCKLLPLLLLVLVLELLEPLSFSRLTVVLLLLLASIGVALG